MTSRSSSVSDRPTGGRRPGPRSGASGVSRAMPTRRRGAVTGPLALLLALLVAGTPAAVEAGQQAEPGRQQQAEQGQNQTADEGQQQAGRQETVTVTATRLPVRLADMPTAVTIFDAERLAGMPALVLDDALRWAPSFSLFRRTSSQAAHPTAQGANLRGIGPSGVSRALVLVDGVPMNDPFGGWVYWDRIPLLAVERVQVAPGGGSAPYGSHALGGVIALSTRSAGGPSLRLQALGGGRSTARVGLATGLVEGSLGLLGSGEVFHTGGYVATAPADRGPVDTAVASSHQSARLRIDLPASVTLHLEGLRERRENGTPLQRNDTELGGGSGHWSHSGNSGGVDLHGFARKQTFESTFTSVADDRASEQLVLEQQVPATDLGAGGFGWLPLGDEATLSVGGDWRRMAGRSEERVVVIDLRREPGGTQQLGGAFAGLDWQAAPAVDLSLAVRADAWRQRPDEGTDGTPRDETTLSPRIGVSVRAGDGLALRGSAYRAFRAPTLNELYRQFRVGDVLTRANPDLEEERLVGAEAGLDWAPPGAPLDATVRATVYWSRLDNAVINATESITPDLIFRRRRNLGAATSRGVELEGSLSPADGWTVDASFSWLGARVEDDPVLEGKRLPQVPEYRARGSLRYMAPRGWQALLSVGAVGVQFDDDLNELPLASAAILDGALELPLTRQLRLTVRGENLLDQEVAEKRTPLLTLGPPRTLVLGVDITLPGSR